MKCPKCGAEMVKRKSSFSKIRYECRNASCPIIGVRGGSKTRKDGTFIFVSGELVFDSTYTGKRLEV